jgi:anti-anti-sigma factor
VGLQISIRKSGDVTILDLLGRSTASDLLSSHLQTLVANGARKLVLNLADLTLLDSAGVSAIMRTCLSLRSQGGDLKLLCPRGHVLDMFSVIHLLEILSSFEDETQALSSFRPSLPSHQNKGATVF